MGSGATDGEHERRLLRVVGIEIALPLFEAPALGPIDSERAGAVAQPPDRPIIGFRHDPEQPGVVLV